MNDTKGIKKYYYYAFNSIKNQYSIIMHLLSNTTCIY